jgi:hypothetical protein
MFVLKVQFELPDTYTIHLGIRDYIYILASYVGANASITIEVESYRDTNHGVSERPRASNTSR